ncbi:MAG: hypothetical protein ABL949_10340 [Fimbriimonadaceae bacterium]
MLTALVASLGLVTFDSLAARVPVVLEKLSPLVGQKLECDSSFTNEVVVVHVKGVEPSELLDTFAFANVGIWRKEKEGDKIKFVLAPDPKRRAQQEKEYHQKRVASIQRILDTFKEELAQPYSIQTLEKAILEAKPIASHVNDYYKTGPQERLQPCSRLAMRVLIGLGAKKLETIADGNRLVLSSEPTPMQQQLSNSDDLRAQFDKEQDVLIATMQGMPPEKVSAFASFTGSTGLIGTGARLAHVGRLLVTVSDILGRYPRDPVWISISEAGGRPKIGRFLQMGIAPTLAPELEAREFDNIELKLNRSSTLMFTVIRNSYNQDEDVPSVLRSRLLDPVAEDPLIHSSELYGQFAEAQGRNLLAVINDSAFSRFLDGSQALNVREFRQKSQAGMVLNESPDWVVMTPSSPVEARRNRDNRSTIRSLFESLSTGVIGSAKVRSIYLLERPFANARGLGAVLAPALFRNIPYQLFQKDEDLQRLFGSLSARQESDLIAGKSLVYSGLTKKQKEIMNRIIFGELYGGDGSTPSRPVFKWQAYGDGNGSFEQLRISEDPSDVLLKGIPESAEFAFSIFQNGLDLEPRRQGEITSHGFSYRSPYDPYSGLQEVARARFFGQHPEFVEGAISEARFPDRFIALQRLDISMQLQIGAGIIFRGWIRAAVPISAPVKFDELPKNYQDAVNAEIEKLNQQLKEGAKFRFIVHPVPKPKPPPPILSESN